MPDSRYQLLSLDTGASVTEQILTECLLCARRSSPCHPFPARVRPNEGLASLGNSQCGEFRSQTVLEK